MTFIKIIKGSNTDLGKGCVLVCVCVCVCVWVDPKVFRERVPLVSATGDSESLVFAPGLAQFAWIVQH